MMARGKQTVSTHTDALVTVVYPLAYPRGRAVDRVRTWTESQSLARNRYRVVVASDGTDPAQEREVEATLGPHDALVRAPGQDHGGLTNAGAARATTPWLVLTEGHCRADPGCLEAAVQWITTGPVEGAGNFTIGHDDQYLLARLSRRWFDEIHARWRTPDEWPRLHRAAFAIRADLFKAVGGFEPAYGQFAAPLLSARLLERGVAIGPVSGAVVVHVDDERMWSHHADTADHASGELDARSKSDPVFFERYFGHVSLWANRLRHRPRLAWVLFRAVAVAALASPRRLPGLVAPLWSLASACVIGVGPRVWLNRLAIALDEVAVERVPLPAAWQWSRFLRAHARVVHLAQLTWIRHRNAHVPPRSGTGYWPIESVGSDMIVGVHGLERAGERWFRWTEPIVWLRVAPPPGEHELRVETTGMRGPVLGAVVAVVADGHVLPRALLGEEGSTLVVRLTAEWSAAARDGLVLVCSPLVPARSGVRDGRRLGLPVLSVTVRPGSAPAGAVRCAV
jgi:hypothetical protein